MGCTGPITWQSDYRLVCTLTHFCHALDMRIDMRMFTPQSFLTAVSSHLIARAHPCVRGWFLLGNYQVTRPTCLLVMVSANQNAPRRGTSPSYLKFKFNLIQPKFHIAGCRIYVQARFYPLNL